MSHDHNYKVQEGLTISIWGNSCLLLGNIARIMQINQSCFPLCIVMSSYGSHRFVIFVMFFLLFWFHWYSKRYQAMSNRWEHKLERFLFQNDHHFRRKSWFRNLVGAEFALWIFFRLFYEQWGGFLASQAIVIPAESEWCKDLFRRAFKLLF